MSQQPFEAEFDDVLERLSSAAPAEPSALLAARIRRLESPEESAVTVSLRCVYCHDGLTSAAAAYCASCLAPHHADCFASHGRCAVGGCEETRTVRPQPSEGPARRPLPGTGKGKSEGQGKRRTRYLPLLFVGLAGAGIAAFALSSDPEPEGARIVQRVEPEPAKTEPPKPEPEPPAPVITDSPGPEPQPEPERARIIPAPEKPFRFTEELTGKRICALGVDSDDRLWVLCDRALLTWSEDRGFVTGSEVLGGGAISARFFGGGKGRGLYLTQPPAGGSRYGKLFRIEGGRIDLWGEFYHPDASEEPRIYVARDGRLFNWGDQFIAVSTGGGWQRSPVKLGSTVSLFEVGDTVHFLWRQDLISVGPDNKPRRRTIAVGKESRIGRARLWGEDRLALIAGEPGGLARAFACDLESLEVEPLDELNELFSHPRSRLHDLIPTAEGGLLACGYASRTNTLAFYEVSAEGAPTRLEQTAGLRWGPRAGLREGLALHARDRATWIGLEGARLMRYRSDALSIDRWPLHGAQRIRHLVEDSKGRIYAATYKSVLMGRSDGRARTTLIQHPPGATEDWERIALAGPGPVRDGEGCLWMFRADRPGWISRWDGLCWLDIRVPFKPEQVSRIMADDQGWVLACPGDALDGVYAIAPDGSVRRFASLTAMLEAAVARGARRFPTALGFKGLHATADGRIWLAYAGSGGADYYDGERWRVLSFPEGLRAVQESEGYGAVFRTRDGSYLVDRDGQLEALPASPLKVLGPRGLQPFEPEILASHRRRHYLAAVMSGGRPVLVDSSGHKRRGRRLPHGEDTRVFRSLIEGFWSEDEGERGQPHRIVGRHAFPLNLQGTPIASQAKTIRRVLDDRDGGVWYFPYGYAVYHRRPKDKLSLSWDNPTRLRCRDKDADQLRFYWGSIVGQWEGGERGPVIEIPRQPKGPPPLLLAVDEQGLIRHREALPPRPK